MELCSEPQHKDRRGFPVLCYRKGRKKNQWEVEEMGEHPLHKNQSRCATLRFGKERVLLSCKEGSFKTNPERREGLKEVNQHYCNH